MPNTSALVSIALASFNGEKFIGTQLDSILNQTWNRIEIVVSDDGSTDKTWQILSKYARKYDNIRLYRSKRNRGFLKNFEFAISKCNGDYIALCDQDDEWHPRKIEKLMSIIGRHDMAASDLRVIDTNGNEIAPSLEKYQGLFIPHQKDLLKTLILRNCFTGCTMLFTKQLAKRCLPIPQQAIVHDWWLAINAASGRGIVYSSLPLVSYRQHGDNAIGAKNREYESIKNKVNILSSRRRIYMRKRFSDFASRIQAYLELGSFTPEERQYLHDVLLYYKGYLSFSKKWQTLYYGLKHRKYLVPKGNTLKKILLILAKMV